MTKTISSLLLERPGQTGKGAQKVKVGKLIA
jgi:hypothetical protein